MAVNYGQVAIVPKGEWNVETQYKVNNLVSYDGSSYVAKVQPPVGTLPTDTSYWQVSAAGTKKATADSLGTVMPDGTTTSVGEGGKLSVNTAQQDALGVVKGSDDITVGEDGNLTVNTTFEQATEIANIIAGEAIKSVLGKVSKAIATTMSLDENALLKNMISGIDVNDGNKVPSSAYIHSLVERIGMGTALEGGFDNLTAGLNSVNNNLSNINSRLDTPLYSSVLDYALTLSEGLHAVRFPGTGYTGTDLPDSSYMYSSATISVRATGKIATVLLFGISKSRPLAVNSCENGKWKGWDQYVTKDDLGVTEYNAVGQISLSGKLSKIGEWVKNNGTLGRCTFVRVEPSDSDGYFGTSGFSILWTRTSVNYGWCILISDNPKMVVFGRNSAGWHWYAPSLTEVS